MNTLNSNLTFRERALAIQHLIHKANDAGISAEDIKNNELQEKLKILSDIGLGVEKLSRALTSASMHMNKLTAQGRDTQDFLQSLKNHKTYIDQVFNKCLHSNC